MKKLFVEDIDYSGKRVLIRVDFNVPLNDAREITDDTRIKAALPTIKYVVDHGGKAVLMSHLGNPKTEEMFSQLRMDPVAARLSELLGKKVLKLDDCIGPEVEEAVSHMADGDVILLENLRFHKGEKKNDEEFSKSLARLGDVYVNDAFGTSHRAHASMVGVTKYFEQCACGYLLRKEIDFLDEAVNNPSHPFLAIIGGAKVSSKIGVLENLLSKVDTIIIGGAMAYTFLKSQGFKVGNSLVEDDKLGIAKKTLEDAKVKNVEIILPVDHRVAKEVADGVPSEIVGKDIADGMIGVDVGPESIALYTEKIKSAKTILWNGPLGVFEIKDFSFGTFEVARLIAETDCVSIIGGGDSVSAVNKSGLADKMSHISTGGGASLEYLEGKPLPGIEALTDK
ncbi:MAG: phosphoglycerate kinase [Candidatus Ancaeobacter aquaticus]|nr:phosphoglycerate kinase [Candidatus Ancaeobacter aquaticus]